MKAKAVLRKNAKQQKTEFDEEFVVVYVVVEVFVVELVVVVDYTVIGALKISS